VILLKWLCSNFDLDECKNDLGPTVFPSSNKLIDFSEIFLENKSVCLVDQLFCESYVQEKSFDFVRDIHICQLAFYLIRGHLVNVIVNYRVNVDTQSGEY
jgi:hypothetical protein